MKFLRKLWLKRQHRLALMLLLCWYCSLIPPIESKPRRDKQEQNEPVVAAQTSMGTYYGNQHGNTYSHARATPYVSSYDSTLITSRGGTSTVTSTEIKTLPPYTGPMDKTGFCVRRRDMKLMCYCTPDDGSRVRKAECWIFSDSLLANDSTWSRFFQEKEIRDLKFVVQNHGRLTYIPTVYIDPLKSLSSFMLEYAQIEVVQSHAFANLAYLERIVLSNNQLMILDQDAFANHIRLRELNLEHNQIYEISLHAFRNLPACERLYLNNNNISNLHENLFKEMGNLLYLNLASNQISVLTKEVWGGLGNLNILKLTHNFMNFIGDNVFTELWSLVELHIDDNRIEGLSERAFDGLNNLRNLNLANNMLKKIETGLMRGVPALLSLNVKNNELETLTVHTFQPIMDKMLNNTWELLVAGNNFICDCRLQWLYDLRNRTSYKPLRKSLEEFVCTLSEPKLSNFIDPPPRHILDLLNIGRGKKRQRNNMQRAQMQSSRQYNGSLAASYGAQKKKRSLPKAAFNTAEHTAVIANSHEDDRSQKTDLRMDYYDQHGMMAHQVEHEDDLDQLKKTALFNAQQVNPKDLDTNNLGTAEHVASKPVLAIKVRLFTLKSENLPCNNDLLDPTELPLSRDLMDVRSNTENEPTSNAFRLCAPMATQALFVLLGLGLRAF